MASNTPRCDELCQSFGDVDDFVRYAKSISLAVDLEEENMALLDAAKQMLGHFSVTGNDPFTLAEDNDPIIRARANILRAAIAKVEAAQ